MGRAGMDGTASDAEIQGVDGGDEVNEQELKNVLDLHRKWVLGEGGGSRADLRDADLGGQDLREADRGEADLRDAYLRDADLRSADLGGADLGGANLRGADLREADLSGADLGEIKADYLKVLAVAKGEALGLYDALQKG